MASRDLRPGELFRVHIDRRAVDRLADDLTTRQLVIDTAREIARDAQRRAVKDNGEGARSIQEWPGRDRFGWYADVSWDQDHFYMSFHEFGTSKHPQRPAVEPAFDHYLHL